MDCRAIPFSPDKSNKRIQRALRVFPEQLLLKILALALYLLGAPRKFAASMASMPETSLNTYISVVMRDGFPALRDRRYDAENIAPQPPKTQASTPVSVRKEDQWVIVTLPGDMGQLRLPIANKIQLRTVLLTLFNSDLITLEQAAQTLELGQSRCRQLARQLSSQDVNDVLIDKRRGQLQDFRVGPEQKAQIILHFTARTITGHSTSSDTLAQALQEDGTTLAPRTIRWHLSKLALSSIKFELPNLVETLKKTLESAP